MKRNKKLIFMTLALAAAVALCVVVSKLADKDEAKTEENVVFAEINKDDITALEWRTDGETDKFVKNSGGWSLDGDSAFPVNTSMIDSMENSVSEAKSSRALSDVTPSDYGIDESSDFAAVYKKDGACVKLLFGNKNDITDEYYMQVDGDSKVYMIAASVKQSFERKKSELLKKETLPDMGEADKLTVKKGDTSLEIVKSETGEGDDKKTEWKAGDTVLSTQKTEDMRQSLSGMVLGECVSYNADDETLEKYGLLSPSAEVKLESGNETEELCFGNEDGENVYVRLKDSKMIYQTDKEIMSSIVTDASALTDTEE